jgi:uncharacterized membrane protein
MDLLTPIEQKINRGIATVGFIGLGAGLMYVLDPDRGRRRRALVRDKARLFLHDTEDSLDIGMRDLANRARGVVSELTASFRSHVCDDDVLSERVHTCLGRLTSHPGAIQVRAENGNVTLSGPVLASEVDRVLTGVRRVRGVRSVNNQLSVHDAPGDIPDLQGSPSHRLQAHLQQRQLTPAERLLMTIGGVALTANGLRRGGLLGTLYGLAGASILARNMRTERRHFAYGSDLERGIDIQKTITIEAPPDRVFGLLSNPENFPQVMSHLEQVTKIGEKTYHWRATGPAGTSVEWDSELVDLVPNQLIVWKSKPGSVIDNAGVVRLDSLNGGTRIHIRMSYNPPGGVVGHAVAGLFGSDPKRVLDDDLARFKSLMERGKTTIRHHKVTLDQVS